MTIRHGQGYSRYESSSRNLHHDLVVYVPPTDAIKIMHLSVKNNAHRTRRLSATYFAEWVLGTQREEAAMQVVCERDAQSGAIMAQKSMGYGIPRKSGVCGREPGCAFGHFRSVGVSGHIWFGFAARRAAAIKPARTLWLAA